MDEDGPRLRHDLPGGRHETLPEAAGQQQNHVDQPVDDPEENGKKVPLPGHADSVTVAGQTQPRREIPLILIGRVDAVAGDFERREPRPLAVGRTVDVAIEPGMIHKDGKAAPDQQDQQQEVDVMGDAQPRGKAARFRPGFQFRRGENGNTRQAGQQVLAPGGEERDQRQRREQKEQPRPNPDAQAAIRGVFTGIRFRIFGSHERTTSPVDLLLVLYLDSRQRDQRMERVSSHEIDADSASRLPDTTHGALLASLSNNPVRLPIIIGAS